MAGLLPRVPFIGGLGSHATSIADVAGLQASLDAASTHAARSDNPHTVTKTQVGLGNADNTSDVNKPVSTAQSTADTAIGTAAANDATTKANAAQAAAIQRANHTGTQLAATISDLGTVATLSVDTDTTLSANSDIKIPSQKAVKAYVDLAVTGLLDFKGGTSCSGNPNYPAASKGDSYVVTAAGKIGGGSGTSVDIGDVYFANADNAGGTEASVGTSWAHLEHNLVGALLTANNLSDLTNAATARANLNAASLAANTFTGSQTILNSGTGYNHPDVILDRGTSIKGRLALQKVSTDTTWSALTLGLNANWSDTLGYLKDDAAMPISFLQLEYNYLDTDALHYNELNWTTQGRRLLHIAGQVEDPTVARMTLTAKTVLLIPVSDTTSGFDFDVQHPVAADRVKFRIWNTNTTSANASSALILQGLGNGATGTSFTFLTDRFATGVNNFAIYDDITGTERIFIKENGNIALGGNAPTERLDVTGNIKASGTIVAGSNITASGNVSAVDGTLSGNLAVGTGIFGNITAGNYVKAQELRTDKVASSGYNVFAQSGSAPTGYVGWHKGDGTRLGYMGNGATNLDLTLENGAVFAVAGSQTLTGSVTAAGLTSSAANVLSVNGASGTPAVKVTGIPFAGTSTTAKPLLLIEPSTVTVSNNWTTSGALIGGNAPAAFAGDLINLQKNGDLKFNVSSAGDGYLFGNLTINGGLSTDVGLLYGNLDLGSGTIACGSVTIGAGTAIAKSAIFTSAMSASIGTLAIGTHTITATGVLAGDTFSVEIPQQPAGIVFAGIRGGTDQILADFYNTTGGSLSLTGTIKLRSFEA